MKICDFEKNLIRVTAVQFFFYLHDDVDCRMAKPTMTFKITKGSYSCNVSSNIFVIRPFLHEISLAVEKMSSQSNLG